MAILAAGVGFAVRGSIFADWGREFGFTGGELGAIGGAGFTGFCFGIIIGGVVADTIGYGWLVIAAFALHVLSAVITFAATPTMGHDGAYNCLKWGMFVFAYANGTLEAVANPLVATLFPQNRTHYLNILHASWPLGMVIGTLLALLLGGQMQMGWKVQLATYLIPTVFYGVMFLGQKMPKSEASVKGVSFGEMFKDVGILGGLVICFLLVLFCQEQLGLGNAVAYSIGGVLLLGIGAITNFSIGALLLFVLFVTHALVGAVELGTDQWIQNITGNILSPKQGQILFLVTSGLMFALRFCAHFIEKNLGLSPVGLLCTCAALACLGLNLVSGVDGFAMALIAVCVYALGKTFFWPTMLAVASDRFPRTGAVAISIMGGIGMMSAGLIGSPGLGYFKDRYAGEELQAKDAALYNEYKAPKPTEWLSFIFTPATGLDGTKLGDAKKAVTDGTADAKQKTVHEADQTGDRKTLKTDSTIPATMAVIYLLMLLYFKAIGGYKPIHVEDERAHDMA
ncbi:MAG TPA: MFS transporter [Verrucomicrobiaceae bacterium]